MECLLRRILPALAIAGMTVIAAGCAGSRPKPTVELGPTEQIAPERAPEAVFKAVPLYPEAARRDRIEGTVTVQVLVGRDGRVREARILKSIPALDVSALEAARRWRFRPGLQNGAPAAVWVAIPLRFPPDRE